MLLLVLVVEVLTEETPSNVLDNVDGVKWFDVLDSVAVDDALDDVNVLDEDEEVVDETATVAEDNVVKFGNETVLEEDDEI